MPLESWVDYILLEPFISKILFFKISPEVSLVQQAVFSDTSINRDHDFLKRYDKGRICKMKTSSVLISMLSIIR